jgi:RNA polymerase sigma factor (sigma-70 family)
VETVVDDLAEALEALSTKEKSVIYWMYYEDLTDIEIAFEMNISLQSVREIKLQAIDRLRAVLMT